MVGWFDEMRVGLRGMVRRVWAPRGVKVRQKLQLIYKWRYLSLAADVLSGRIFWAWTETTRGEELLEVIGGLVEASDFRALVWDQAPGHKLARSYDTGLHLVEQPAYSPELNPVERVFEELRRKIEGKVYESLEEKVQAVEAELEKLDSDPERVRRLTNWSWIRQSIESLPQPITP